MESMGGNAADSRSAWDLMSIVEVIDLLFHITVA